MDWIHLAHARVQRWSPVNNVMNLQIAYEAGSFFNNMNYYQILNKDSAP